MKTLITKLNELKNKRQRLDKARVSTNKALQAVIKDAGNAAAIDAVTNALYHPLKNISITDNINDDFLGLDAVIITNNYHFCDRDLLAGYVQTITNGKAILSNHNDKAFNNWAYDKSNNDNVLTIEIDKSKWTKNGYSWACKLSLKTAAVLGNTSSLDSEVDYHSKQPKIEGVVTLPSENDLNISYNLMHAFLANRKEWLKNIIKDLDATTDASVKLNDAVEVKEMTNDNFQKSIDEVNDAIKAAKKDYLKVGAIITMPADTYSNIDVSENNIFNHVSQLEVLKVTPKSYRVKVTTNSQRYIDNEWSVVNYIYDNVLLPSSAVIDFLDRACYVTQNPEKIKTDKAVKEFKQRASIRKIYENGDRDKLAANAQFKKLYNNIRNFYNDFSFYYKQQDSETIQLVNSGCIWKNNHRYNYEMQKVIELV